LNTILQKLDKFKFTFLSSEQKLDKFKFVFLSSDIFINENTIEQATIMIKKHFLTPAMILVENTI